jgi:hypothetical protein
MARRGSRSSAVALSRATRTPNTKEKRFFQEAGPPVRADPAAEVARPHVDACGRPRVRMALLKGEAGVDLSRATCSSPRPRAPASRRCGARASLTRRVSSTYGPALDRSWVEGLAVEPCLKTPALLHHLHQSRHRPGHWLAPPGAQRGLGRRGLSVNKVLQSFPLASGIKCEEKIRPFMHTLVMWNTELSEGEVGRRQEGTRARSGAAQLAAGLVRQIPRQGSVFIMAQARCRVLRVFLVAQSACYLLQGAGLG